MIENRYAPKRPQYSRPATFSSIVAPGPNKLLTNLTWFDINIYMNLIGKRVYVYRNLKHGKSSAPLYSVMYKGTVIAHRRKLLMTDCEFKVRNGGYKQFLKTGRKNVHAFVVGTVVRSAYGINCNGSDLPIKIGYNPSLGNTFYTKLTHKVRAVNWAGGVLINGNGISACYVIND